jgi:hypothetical protein
MSKNKEERKNQEKLLKENRKKLRKQKEFEIREKNELARLKNLKKNQEFVSEKLEKTLTNILKII